MAFDAPPTTTNHMLVLTMVRGEANRAEYVGGCCLLAWRRTDGSHAESNQAGDDKQRRHLATSTMLSKKSHYNASDNNNSRRSKKTRSDDKVSSPEESGGVDTANLEAIKGLLRKKGSGTPSPKGPTNKTDKKKAKFAEVAKKSVLKKPAPAIEYKRCVAAFSEQHLASNLSQLCHFFKLILTRTLNFCDR